MIRLLTQQFEAQIQASDQPWLALPGLVGIQIPLGGKWDKARIPDVTVLTLNGWQALADREAVIDFEDPAPRLVVEGVSPSTQLTDYQVKRSQDAVRDIPEYWVVDPLASNVSVCTLDDRLYDLSEYQGSEPIRSGTFANLALTVQPVMGV